MQMPSTGRTSKVPHHDRKKHASPQWGGHRQQRNFHPAHGQTDPPYTQAPEKHYPKMRTTR